MSDAGQSNGAANHFYQKQFGAAPGGPDAKAECANWQRLCDTLLAERARLREEVEKLRLEQLTREWEKEPVPSWEEAQAMIDRSTTFEQIIADLKREVEAENGQR